MAPESNGKGLHHYSEWSAMELRALRAEAAIQRVRELHAPVPGSIEGHATMLCQHCYDPYEWCDTIAALDGSHE